MTTTTGKWQYLARRSGKISRPVHHVFTTTMRVVAAVRRYSTPPARSGHTLFRAVILFTSGQQCFHRDRQRSPIPGNVAWLTECLRGAPVTPPRCLFLLVHCYQLHDIVLFPMGGAPGQLSPLTCHTYRGATADEAHRLLAAQVAYRECAFTRYGLTRMVSRKRPHAQALPGPRHVSHAEVDGPPTGCAARSPRADVLRDAMLVRTLRPWRSAERMADCTRSVQPYDECNQGAVRHCLGSARRQPTAHGVSAPTSRSATCATLLSAPAT